jgi:arylsulfatase A-like enzyme
MASHDPQRPNVLFILSDDQGAWSLGCSGNDEIRTPHLDALAASGKVPCPIAQPGRIAPAISDATLSGYDFHPIAALAIPSREVRRA